MWISTWICEKTLKSITAKRKLVDECGVCDLKASNCAAIRGVSPVKWSKKNSDVKYFDGRISNGMKVARLV